ncbi:hypothetical protein [Spirillospora sp. NPDC047279]|uniref:hypothetical protein n=1 Tax=Spirillospora sp. NPDC047279 TaxID=3155478 RepID=UPI0033D6E889
MPALVAAAFLLAGCSGGSPEADVPKTPSSRPDEPVRTAVSAGLARDGRASEAKVVTAGGSRLTPLPAPFLNDWRVLRVDYRQGSHPVMFHVALHGAETVLLTGDAEAFDKVVKAAGVKVGDAATATQVAGLYLQTVRPGGTGSYQVDGVDQIKFRPGITGETAARRDAIVGEYRSVIKPPAAVAKGGGFTAAAYVVKGRELQRRDLTIRADGTVTDRPRTLVSDLPVAYVL